MKKITLLLLLFTAGLFTTVKSQTTSVATYTITYTSTWNDTDHTNAMDATLPASAHWSKLVGVNHNSSVDFIEIGGMASLGIEMIAESGTNDEFRDTDVANAIGAGDAEQYIEGPSLGSAAGTMTITGLEVSDDFPILSLFTMVAPSPDWMMVIDGLELMDGSGNWKSGISIPVLYAYDAGTDTGINYTSPNADSNAIISVFNPANTNEPFNGNSIGSLSVTLTNVLSVDDVDAIDSVKLFPNPTQGNLTITNSRDLETVEIYNVLGSLVKRIDVKQDTKLELDLSDLSKGMYLVRISDINANTKTQKLILE